MNVSSVTVQQSGAIAGLVQVRITSYATCVWRSMTFSATGKLYHYTLWNAEYWFSQTELTWFNQRHASAFWTSFHSRDFKWWHNLTSTCESSLQRPSELEPSLIIIENYHKESESDFFVWNQKTLQGSPENITYVINNKRETCANSSTFWEMSNRVRWDIFFFSFWGRLNLWRWNLRWDKNY